MSIVFVDLLLSNKVSVPTSSLPIWEGCILLFFNRLFVTINVKNQKVPVRLIELIS
jgi:hypothetical protein